jgi:hypothetical protein
MPPIPFADNFLAGSLLTLLVPVGLLIAIAVWYVFSARRAYEEPTTQGALPAPEVLAAAAPAPEPPSAAPPPAGSPSENPPSTPPAEQA